MSSYLEDSDSDEEVSKVPVDPEAVKVATEEAAAMKATGNTAFGAGNYEEALESYTAAVNALKVVRADRDPLILLNRSATYLALKRYVPALYDANQAADVDPTNWKAHWRQGVALGGMARKSFRAKQAIAAFEKCKTCEVPENKKAEVQQVSLTFNFSILVVCSDLVFSTILYNFTSIAYNHHTDIHSLLNIHIHQALMKAKQVMEAIDAETPMPDMSNCAPS